MCNEREAPRAAHGSSTGWAALCWQRSRLLQFLVAAVVIRTNSSNAYATIVAALAGRKSEPGVELVHLASSKTLEAKVVLNSRTTPGLCWRCGEGLGGGS